MSGLSAGGSGSSGATRASQIRARALELGFDRVGIALAARASRAASFETWLDRGFHGEMGYLARDPTMRADPRLRDEWARSVVCVSMNYLPFSGEREQAPGILGGIARYATGDDYHELMRERLETLLGFIRIEMPGARGRIAVDSSPVLEREMAEAAGIGWFAKNTMIIDEKLGSWTLLGEIVTDLELEPDSPVEDRCGSCRACLDACPTGAILEEGLLDATRCISYFTIELRGAIPTGNRSDVADHLFGCDICQEVCPWNRGAPETSEPAFRPRASYEGMTLADVARLTEERFREVFAGSAVRRSKRRGLVRNALIVGANTGDGDVLEVAGAALQDHEPVVRAAAAWALGRAAGRGVGTRRDRETLESALDREDDPAVRSEIAMSLEGDSDG